MPQIKIISGGNIKTVNAEKGTPLSKILKENDTAAEHPCGGLGICKKCTVNVNGKDILSCRYTVEEDITVVIPEKQNIVSVSGAEESGRLTENVCLCLDIGTTTLALAIVSLDEKNIVKIVTRSNPQRAFGADVISRIDYCRKNGVDDLHRTIVEAVNNMIDELLDGGFANASPEKLYVAGNTTMLHLFFGVDCSSMGESPYTPAFLEGKRISAEDIRIKKVNEIISLPNLSAFVGADIVAGLNYVGLPESGKYNLLIDLGTNAEVVMFTENNFLCTTAAAGPCFEGANISCGMSAVEGAIYAYEEGGAYSVIGNTQARGMCATGLIDIVSELVKSEVIEDSGYMEDEEFEISEKVSLTGEDVRQFQLAKSAVYSAVLSLMEIGGVSFDEIEKMYVSGGFSAKMRIDNAVHIGLLPKELKDRFSPINNSSLLGTVKFALEENDLSLISAYSKYIDLSANPIFSELFIENMFFE
ncbi:MAG: DUF4445 domain-containing protein [Ruminococcaceae bacterium]|nr:DUF4445 domain-containing protein [Oscillospiraceae bacterium]